MGINQWSRIQISASSPICGVYSIKPGEYLIMYDSSRGELIFKEPDQGKIVLRKQLNSPLDLVLLLPDREHSEVMQRLKKKNYPSAEEGLANHHIIPHFLCNESQLVIEAERHGVFKKDGLENLIKLPKNFHKENHGRNSKYSQTVHYYLQDRWNALVEAGLEENPAAIKETLLSLVDAIRDELKAIQNSESSMNNI